MNLAWEVWQAALEQRAGSEAVPDVSSTYRTIAHLIGTIYMAGEFLAETQAERDLELLLIQTGHRYKTWNESEQGFAALSTPPAAQGDLSTKPVALSDAGAESIARKFCDTYGGDDREIDTDAPWHIANARAILAAATPPTDAVLPACQCFTEQQEQYCVRQRKCQGKGIAYAAASAKDPAASAAPATAQPTESEGGHCD